MAGIRDMVEGSIHSDTQEARESGIQILGSCVGPTVVRERLLEAKMAAGEALLAKLVDLPHQHALLVIRQCLTAIPAFR